MDATSPSAPLITLPDAIAEVKKDMSMLFSLNWVRF